MGERRYFVQIFLLGKVEIMFLELIKITGSRVVFLDLNNCFRYLYFSINSGKFSKISS